MKADFISKQFATGLIPLHGLCKQGVIRESFFISNYFIILVSPMSCTPFSNKELEWLPGEQILPLPVFLSKPLAEVVRILQDVTETRKLLQSLLPKPTVLALAVRVPPFPVHLTEPVLFSGPFQGRAALGRKDCSSWDPWQRAAEESVVKHRQGSACTLCP